ncbi:MAG: hypothetical protein K9K75_01910 [Deltaproteobacteria bacterium]|nr:hypothetical protein [Deltaproteobacteria bacterium]
MRFALNKTAATIVVAVCFYAVGLSLSESFSAQRVVQGRDPVSIIERRLLLISQRLTAVGDVGYLAEVDYNTAKTAEYRLQDVEYIARYYLAQYSLAPTRVFHAPNQTFVISHFLESSPALLIEERARLYGLIAVEDFGNGIILYRKR